MLTLKRTLLELFNVENNDADFSVSVSFASKAARECTIRYIRLLYSTAKGKGNLVSRLCSWRVVN